MADFAASFYSLVSYIGFSTDLSSISVTQRSRMELSLLSMEHSREWRASALQLTPTYRLSSTTHPSLLARVFPSSTRPSSRASTIPSRLCVTILCIRADSHTDFAPQLLPDGRVLISGSDPQTPGFPEEMRVEVYIPPYLNDGRTQPSFTVDEKDWEYGGNYTIHVQLFEGTTDTMRVSMIAGM